MSSWYINKDLKPQGPLSHDEIKKKIMRGEIGPTDLLCREGESVWEEAALWRDFPRELFPAFQQSYFKTSNPSEPEWILLIFNPENPQGVQQGPFSVQEVRERIVAGEVSFEDYVWRSGLSGWVQLKDRGEFSVPSNLTT